MMMYNPFDWIISMIFSLLWFFIVIFIVYLIIKLLFFRKKQKIDEKEKQLRELDFTKQLYFFLTVFLLNALLVVVNSVMGDIIPKDVIILIYAIFGIAIGYVFDAFVALWVSLFAVICALGLRYNEVVAYNGISAQFFGIAILMGILYCMIGQLQWENIKKRIPATMLVAGLLSLFGILFFLSIGSGGVEFLSRSLGSVVATPIFIFLFALLLLVNIFLIYLTLSNKKISLPEFGIYSFLALFSSFLFFAPKQQYIIEQQWNNYTYYNYGQELTPVGFFMAVVLSLMVFVFSLIVLYIGNNKKNKLIRRLGLLFFVFSLLSSFFYSFELVGESGLIYLTTMLNSILLLVMFCFIYYLSGESKNERRAQFRASAFAIIPISIFMLFFSSRNGLELFEKSTINFNQLYIYSISLILIICSLFYYLLKTSNVFKRIFYPFVLCLLFFCLPLMNFGESMFIDGSELSGPGLLWSFVFNLLTFLLFLGTILFGYKLKSTGIINIGAVFLFFFIILKYFDWFYSSLDKGLFFILAGFVLLGVGWTMERGRQLLISNIDENYAN